jgi:tetratricopeptide (TPR) repeat protein
MLTHPEYRERYWAIAKQLKTTQPKNVDVLEALADEASQYKNAEGTALTIGYLEDAIVQGATNPADFEELAESLVTANRQADAVEVLRQGRRLNPYNAELFRLSAKIYSALDRMQEACEVAAQANQKFPQDDAIRGFTKKCDTASAGVSH